MKERSFGPDIIRTLAIICVVGIHAVSYTNVLDASVSSLAFPLYVALRFVFMSGVPLFIMLSGYLCCEKKLSRKYYIGILPVLLSYIFITVFTMLYKNATDQQSYTALSAIMGMLNFTAHDYAWYVEMYIGLFLLIPFLNLLFSALGTKRARLALVITLAFLTVLPPTLESFRIGGAELDITADYWRAAYPLTFYFLGAYLRMHPPVLKTRAKILLALMATALPFALCYAFSLMDGSYAWYMMNGFSSLTAAFSATAYFILLSELSPKNKALRFFVREIAVCSFEMYLFSCITDYAVWQIVCDEGITHKSLLFILQFSLSFASAYILARVFRLALVPATELLRKNF